MMAMLSGAGVELRSSIDYVPPIPACADGLSLALCAVQELFRRTLFKIGMI
jgi:hypothetical protein